MKKFLRLSVNAKNQLRSSNIKDNFYSTRTYPNNSKKTKLPNNTWNAKRIATSLSMTWTIKWVNLSQLSSTWWSSLVRHRIHRNKRLQICTVWFNCAIKSLKHRPNLRLLWVKGVLPRNHLDLEVAISLLLSEIKTILDHLPLRHQALW